MRSRTLAQTLQLQAEDGSFVEVQRWVRADPSPMPGSVVMLSGQEDFNMRDGGVVDRNPDGSFTIQATGQRLVDPDEQD